LKLEYELRIMRLEELKEHEWVERRRLKRLKQMLRENKIFTLPIVVDRHTNIILDGHLRFNALKELGYSKVPVYLVDYTSPEIVVKSWRSEQVSKQDVIRAGSTGQKLPPRTSKHMVRTNDKLVHISELIKPVNIPLEELR
jgi:hypothetical protein